MGCSSSTNVETIEAIASQKQLDNPFRISNRGLDLVDRYLTFTNNSHAKQDKLLAEFDLPKEGEQKKSQIWRLQYAQRSRNTFKIKHERDNLYLTLTKSKHLNQYFAELANLYPDQTNQDQIWSFGLGENNRFTIKVQSSEGKIYYLESPQAGTFEEGHSTLFACRPQAAFQRRYLQFWKLSPVITEIPLPQYNIQDVLRYCRQQQIELIKTFKGEIYTRNSPHYFQKIEQYATSSFPSSQMQPYFLTYPQDVKDISCMIKIAKNLCKNLVVRSGGHQYCGLSSGGQDTIVLCMNKFDTLLMNQNGLVEVGPCVPLKRAVKAFKDWEISLPHGECPLVNIGGHGQTGGYGYFIRSFGIFMDYIQAFDIVLANGELKRVNRPLPNAVIKNQQERFNLELFRGVMGGNAGSFGIIIKYFLKGIKDQDHPKSYGFSKIRFFNKDLLTQMMKIQKQWSEFIAKQEDNQKIRGLDLQLTIGEIYIQIFNFKRPMILLEGVYSDPDKGVPYNNQFEQIFQKFSKGQTFMEKMANTFLGRYKGEYPLSILQYKHVRKFPLVTLSGREFDLPYEKRANITMSSLKDQFISQLVEQISAVADISNKSMLVVSQMMFGGGAYKQNGKRKVDGLSVTSIPQRNFVHSFGFDIFYNTLVDPDSKSKAKQLQQKMQQTVDKHYTTANFGEKKFFWASFGDLDMKKQSVVKIFYDSKEDYAILQKLKKKVDPQDIFHSPMTVKLPND